MILSVWNFQKRKIHIDRKQISSWLGLEARTDCKHAQMNLGGLMKMDCDDCCTTLYLFKISTILTMGKFYSMYVMPQ